MNTDKEIIENIKYHLTMLNGIEVEYKLSDCGKATQGVLREILGI